MSKETDAGRRAEIARLKAENARLERELDRLANASDIASATYQDRFRAIATLGRGLPVGLCCHALGVARSGYYQYLGRCGLYARRSTFPQK
ncbi:hypothetical protein JXB37_04865 [candidate division WOR-3 bacterium]|nr:hypothetical protein [candidate division WOR-3 bacterium]